MTKTVRKQRDRFGRFSLVLNIVTTILVVLSGAVAWRSWRLVSSWADENNGTQASVALINIMVDNLGTAILLLLATLFGYIAIRTVSYIWIGRFWR